jgi:hypothetical protein
MKNLTEAERLEIAKRLAVLDRQMLVGVREVAVLLNTSVASIQQACSARRIARGDVTLKLPPRVNGLGRRVAWRHGDIRDCLEPLQTTTPAIATIGVPAHHCAQPASGAAKGPTRMGRKRKA